MGILCNNCRASNLYPCQLKEESSARKLCGDDVE